MPQAFAEYLQSVDTVATATRGAVAISISKGNSKIGDCPSVSLSPVDTCAPNTPCVRECYACKLARIYPSARAAWERNTRLYRENPADYWSQVHAYLARKNPARFRFHVSGDIPTREYLQTMLAIAREFPRVQFLCYSKRYAWLVAEHKRGAFPANLTIVASAWPNVAIPAAIAARFPVAFMLDGRETRAARAFVCPGNCAACNYHCWSLASGASVAFHRH
jgi:hypothetical protein